MPVACLVVPSLALACELAHRPQLQDHPVVLTDAAGLRVAELTAPAAQRNVRPGQTLREATALCPRITILEPHPAQNRRFADALRDAMASVSPIVEQPEPGAVCADLRGLDLLYPQPGDVERAILQAAPPAPAARLGVADERFTAYVAARSAQQGQAHRVPAGQSAAFLADKPTAWLPLPPDDQERLHLFGIHTIGALAELPRHAVAAQFGLAGETAWLAASGADPTPVAPDPFVHTAVVESSRAEPPLVSREAILHSTQQLLRRALRHPRASGRFVRRLRLRLVMEEDRLWERSQALREPMSDRDRLWLPIRSALERAELAGPVVELELELGALTAESGRQPSLFRDGARRREQLNEMARHLKAQHGRSPLSQIVPLEPWSRIPERRYALMDYDP
ncbi:MAG: DNA polymerase-4/protein ImuB [Chloroflexi bacterium]|nr:MAG: DNA polymerase-4/protein ImuB [Chloroflexota bacterium]